MKDRKKRISVKSDVFITRRAQAEGIDLSEEGMYVYCRQPFVKGAIINISFTLEDSLIPVTAEVAHSEPGVGMGMKFLEVSPSDMDKIRRYIDHEKGVVELNHTEDHSRGKS